MRIFLIILFVMFLNLEVSQLKAQQTAKKKPTQKEILDKIYFAMARGDVTGYLNSAYKKMAKGYGNGKPLPAIQYQAYSLNAKEWLKYRWFEVDTEVSKKWIQKVIKMIDYLARVKGYIDGERFKGDTNTKEYKEAMLKFSKAYDMLGKLLKKPGKVGKKRYLALKRAKKQWQKDMLRKYKMQ
ncbi:MAG: hypothetical protein GY750_19330 [Lentisphaerae bacterium]|nr:hypothetical protein [Lentisphaerota bacterium]MCP4103551.1 hypothetical protein [Lentisphaerota bacterium]